MGRDGIRSFCWGYGNVSALRSDGSPLDSTHAFGSKNRQGLMAFVYDVKLAGTWVELNHCTLSFVFLTTIRILTSSLKLLLYWLLGLVRSFQPQ